VTAVLVARGGRALEARELVRFLEDRLARYKIPRIFEVRESLPRTATGKLLKHLLRDAA